jgi:hypothetical protein
MRSRQRIAHLSAPECRATIIREAQILTAVSRSSVVKSAARSPSQRAVSGLSKTRTQASIIVRLASDAAFADVTGGYFSVSGARALVPVAPGADRQAQQALWQATAERVAGFSRDEIVDRRAGE